MRSLRIVVRQGGGTLPLVVAASVTALAACGRSTRSDHDSNTAAESGAGGTPAQGGTASGGGGTSGGVIVTGGTPSGGTTGGTIPTGGTISTGGSSGNASCRPSCDEFIVSIPAAGMPIEPGQVCAATIEPVESNRAAFVTFEASPTNPQAVTGLITLDSQVTVMGTPVLEVLDASYPELLELEMSPLTRTSDGFSFTGTWPNQFTFTPADGGYGRVTMRVSLEVPCDGGSRLVHAVTDVHLCFLDGLNTWESSGQTCCVCRIIAEMAPSPIVPDKHTDELPLAQAIRLRIVELARVSNTIILLAENDGGEGLEYEWLPSTGRIERLADDVIAWTLEDGMAYPFVQAAVYGPNAAAVASFAFNDRAA